MKTACRGNLRVFKASFSESHENGTGEQWSLHGTLVLKTSCFNWGCMRLFASFWLLKRAVCFEISIRRHRFFPLNRWDTHMFFFVSVVWSLIMVAKIIIRDILQNENCNFRKGPGTRCEKNGACSRISTRKFVWTAFFANKFFVSRSDFREVNPVVQLVQNGGSVGSFLSTGFASLFFPSRFGLRWCSVDRHLDFGEWHAGWLFEPGAAVDRRPSIQFELAMDLILRLRVGRAAHQLFFVDVTVFMREQSEKREVRKSSTTTEQETTPRSWSQTVQTTRLGCQTDRSKLYTPPAARAMINSPIEQKLQFSVCKTTRRFAGPSLLSCVLKPSFTKVCIRISLCKTSLLSLLVCKPCVVFLGFKVRYLMNYRSYITTIYKSLQTYSQCASDRKKSAAKKLFH